MRIEAFGTSTGVGIAAGLVGISGTSTILSASSITVGIGMFLTGFMLYIGVWEYGQWRLFQDSGPNTTTN